jgi:hypothetical protein
MLGSSPARNMLGEKIELGDVRKETNGVLEVGALLGHALFVEFS